MVEHLGGVQKSNELPWITFDGLFSSDLSLLDLIKCFFFLSFCHLSFVTCIVWIYQIFKWQDGEIWWDDTFQGEISCLFNHWFYSCFLIFNFVITQGMGWCSWFSIFMNNLFLLFIPSSIAILENEVKIREIQQK